jgi:hypothetical protein
LVFFNQHKKDLIPLFLGHFFLVLTIYLIGHLELFPNKINPQGFSAFASDSYACHDQAIILKDFLYDFKFKDWFQTHSRFHTRIASFSYLIFGSFTRFNILALWPVNFLLLCLSWFSWKFLIFQLSGNQYPKVYIWLLFPTITLHFTQLLRDPFYITIYITWINAWVYLFKSHVKSSILKTSIFIITLSPFLYLVRHRFWMLAQLISIFCFIYSIFLLWFKKKDFTFIKYVFIIMLCINSYSIYKMINRHLGLATATTSAIDNDLINKPFTFFYKIAYLRKNFIKSYDQPSNIDSHIQFNSDGDVIKYIPRALQIGLFSPFPSQWFQISGKTGQLGKIISAWEISLMCFVLFITIIKILKNKINNELLICLVVITITTLALGLIVTNGGALYRMRYSTWIIIGALFFALNRGPFFQNDSIKFKETNEKVRK